MVEIKTSLERKREKEQIKREQDLAVYNRYQELLTQNSKSDAAILCASEFNITVQTVYLIKKRVENPVIPEAYGNRRAECI